MPGLIDAHWHSVLIAPDLMTAMTADVGFLNLLAADVARQTLMQGFTSVRDIGGPSFGLRRAIDAALVQGLEAAENWGTYVAVHAYTSRAVRNAIEAGVKSIEHGQLVDEDIVRLMAKQGETVGLMSSFALP